MKWLKVQSTELYEAEIHPLIQSGDIVIETNGNYVEKYGCDPQRTGLILTYDTFSCACNYSCTKVKEIIFNPPS